jgi:hypothetical protein
MDLPSAVTAISAEQPNRRAVSSCDSPCNQQRISGARCFSGSFRNSHRGRRQTRGPNGSTSARARHVPPDGQPITFLQMARGIADRLIRIFTRDDKRHRAVHGGTLKFQNDPHWRDLLLFYEYFHGDNGAGLGASHQTGEVSACDPGPTGPLEWASVPFGSAGGRLDPQTSGSGNSVRMSASARRRWLTVPVKSRS